jgi:hypothetical protein
LTGQNRKKYKVFPNNRRESNNDVEVIRKIIEGVVRKFAGE